MNTPRLPWARPSALSACLHVEIAAATRSPATPATSPGSVPNPASRSTPPCGGQISPAPFVPACGLLLMGLAGGIPVASWAQGNEQAAELESIAVTAYREPTAADATLGEVRILGREEIRASAATDLFELLRRVPGLQASRTGGGGQQGSLFLRGANSNQVLVLIDGQRANSPNLGGYAWERLDLAAIERVEIVPGPRAALYGADAMGGVINVITRPSTGALLQLGSDERQALALSGAWQSEQFDLGASAGMRHDGGLSAQNAHSDYSGPFGAYRHDADQDASRRRHATLHAGWQAREDLRLEWRGLASEGRTAFDTGFGADSSDDEQTLNQMALRWQTHPTGQLTLELGRDDQQWQTGAERIQTRRDQAELRYQWQITPRQSLLAGFSQAEEQAGSSGGFAAYAGGSDLHAAYALWQWRPEPFNLELALRQDDHSAFGTHGTWQAALGWQRGTHRLYLGGGSSFRAPSLAELYDDRYGSANPELQPEQGRHLQAGWHWRYHPRAEWSVALHHSEVTQLIGYGTNYQLTNLGEAGISGAELSHAWEGERWQVEGGWGWLDAADGNGRALLRRAKHQLSLQALYALSPRWQLGGDALWVGPRLDYLPNQSKVGEVDGYLLLGSRLSYAVSRDWRLDLRLSNLLDTDHETVAGYSAPGRAVLLQLRYQPGPESK